jgi:hypothetical protein
MRIEGDGYGACIWNFSNQNQMQDWRACYSNQGSQRQLTANSNSAYLAAKSVFCFCEKGP